MPTFSGKRMPQWRNQEQPGGALIEIIGVDGTPQLVIAYGILAAGNGRRDCLTAMKKCVAHRTAPP
ncbi:MAG: hypothetical protein NTZ05_19610, partial [Chloroflexi bacterium]|nr:hypothetical protein [Chloroflexota bacterium]